MGIAALIGLTTAAYWAGYKAEGAVGRRFKEKGEDVGLVCGYDLTFLGEGNETSSSSGKWGSLVESDHESWVKAKRFMNWQFFFCVRSRFSSFYHSVKDLWNNNWWICADWTIASSSTMCWLLNPWNEFKTTDLLPCTKGSWNARGRSIKFGDTQTWTSCATFIS